MSRMSCEQGKTSIWPGSLRLTHLSQCERLSGNSCLINQSGDSSELAARLPCKGKSVRNRGVSQTMPFLVIPRSLLRGGFIRLARCAKLATSYLILTCTVGLLAWVGTWDVVSVHHPHIYDPGIQH